MVWIEKMRPLLEIDHWIHFHVQWTEPVHDKTNKMICAPSEDSDQSGHLPSLRYPSEEELDPYLLKKQKTDQTGQMHRLIWVFAGHTDHFVGFVMLWLNYSYLFDIFSPLCVRVVSCYFYLEEIIVGHESRKFGRTLTSTPTDTWKNLAIMHLAQKQAGLEIYQYASFNWSRQITQDPVTTTNLHLTSCSKKEENNNIIAIIMWHPIG